MKPWGERIAEARERGSFTFEDREDAGGRCWAGCAVSEVAEYMGTVRFRLRDDGSRVWPEDEVLLRHGSDFGRAVFAGNFAWAERLLDAIEDRALQLKRESHA